MNTKTILNIKTDKDLKKVAQETAKELGIPLSTAINSFLKQFVRDRELVISASYKPSSYLANIISESEQEFRDREKTDSFKSTKDMFKSLDA